MKQFLYAMISQYKATNTNNQSSIPHLHGPLTSYAKSRDAHAPGMPGTFSLPPRVGDTDMHHGTCVTPESLTSSFLWSRRRGETFPAGKRMRNPQLYVSGKRPMSHWHRPRSPYRSQSGLDIWWNRPLHVCVGHKISLEKKPFIAVSGLTSTIVAISQLITTDTYKNLYWTADLFTLRWRHNDHDSVSNHQPHGCLLNRLFRRRSKKTSKLRVTGLCGEFTGTGEFPAQRASYAENVSIWWRHHDNRAFNSPESAFQTCVLGTLNWLNAWCSIQQNITYHMTNQIEHY